MTVCTEVPKERVIDCFAKQTYEVPDDLAVLGPDAKPPEDADIGCFRILSQKDGDKRVVWCRKVIAEIKAAKKMFMDLLSKGMVPYKVGIDGKATAEEMKEFDPTAEEVIFMPLRAIAGG
jgi:hypothetical protein